MSNPAFARITPVNPPKTNKNIKPIANKLPQFILILLPHIVATHENTFTPVGIAITNVAAEKYARESTSRPVVYI